MRNPKIVVFYALLAMMLATTNAIAAAEWMPGLSVAGWVAVIGLMAGAALSYSNFPSWTAHLTSWMYGTFVIGVAAGLSQQFAGGLGWRERMLAMGQRLNDVRKHTTGLVVVRISFADQGEFHWHGRAVHPNWER